MSSWLSIYRAPTEEGVQFVAYKGVEKIGQGASREAAIEAALRHEGLPGVFISRNAALALAFWVAGSGCEGDPR